MYGAGAPISKFSETIYGSGSGVVGRERMGTAFPHKKLSGNGVPTREILTYNFLLLLLIKLVIFHCYRVTTFRASQNMLEVKTGHQNFQVLAH